MLCVCVCVCVCVQTIFDRKALWLIHKKKKKKPNQDVSACQCKACRFSPWLGNEDPTCWGATKPACDNKREASLLQWRSCMPQLRPDPDKNK